jgi:hypothetical protein
VSNTSLFAAGPAVDTSGNLTYTPATDASGTSTFDVRVQDDGGTASGGDDTSPDQTFTITVNVVNDEPSFSASNPPSANENSGAQTVNGWATFDAGPPDEDATQTVLAYTVSSVSNTSLFAAGPAVDTSGNLTYTPATDASGTSTFDVRVQDDGGTANGGDDTSPDQTFTITVIETPDPPVAVNDSYNAIGNVGISVPDGTDDVLERGTDDTLNGGSIVTFGPTGNETAVGGNGASVNGGDVTLDADGSFTYDPPAGFEGTDTFVYTLTGPGGSDTGTVSITVSEVIWFVDNDDTTAGGDGRLSNPFQCLDTAAGCFDATAADEANDIIFLADRTTGNYNGGLTLLTGQQFIGDGTTGTLASVTGVILPPFTPTLPTFSGTRPVIANATGNGINLGSGNTVRGLNIGTTSGTGLSGTGVGTLTVSEMAINTGSGTGVNLNTGTLAVTLDSVSSNGAANGIVLASTTGSFSVTGDGSTATQGGNDSGGVIQSTTGDGIVLNSATNVTLRNMTIGDTSATPTDAPGGGNNIAAEGIDAISVTGLSLFNITVARTGSHGIKATSSSGLTLEDSLVLNAGDGNEEHGLDLTSMSGDNFVTDSLFDAFNESGIELSNSSGTVDLTVSGTTFQDNQATTGNFGEEGILLDSSGTGQMTVLVDNCIFDDIDSQAIDVPILGSSSVHLTVQDSDFDETSGGDGVIAFFADGTSGNARSNSVTVSGNTFNDDVAGPFAVLLRNDSTGRLDAIVENNTINDHAGVSFTHDDVGSAGAANGESFVLIGGALPADGNVVTNPTGIGIDVNVSESPATGGDPDVHLSVLNNTVGAPPAFTTFAPGIEIDAFDFARMNLDIAGNAATGDTGIGAPGIALSQFDSTTFRIEGLTGAAAAFVNANNTSTTAATTFGTFSAGNATQPPAATLPSP